MHIPSSIYRVQLQKEFPLDELKNIISYLSDLGVSAINAVSTINAVSAKNAFSTASAVSTVYAASIWNAAPDTTYGYDITNPIRINPEIANFKQLREINQLLIDKGMQCLQDIVPNHMAFNTRNVKLMDVLERGSVSPYYRYFDINWHHQNPVLKGKLMVPFLQKDMHEAMHDREVTLSFSELGLTLKYFNDHYPLSYHAYTFLRNKLSEDQSDLRSGLNQFEKNLQKRINLPEWMAFKKEWISYVRKNKMEKQLEELCKKINNELSALKYIVRNQFYVLCHWKLAEGELNYRRFFKINTLIGLNMEREEVFNESHQLIAESYNAGIIHGVIVDHINELQDPVKYLERLRKLLGPECYIIAEKTLESGERIPTNWPIQGTSGGEFGSLIDELFMDRRGASELVSFHEDLVPGLDSYKDLVLKNKTLILEGHMVGELDNLAEYFKELELLENLSQDRMKFALKALMLSLPVYRIYPDQLPLSGDNKALLNDAFEEARKTSNQCIDELNYLQDLCFQKQVDKKREDNVLLFLKRLMQFTVPLTAKVVEDTPFYLYNATISLDEVDDSLSTPGAVIQYFHEQMINRIETNPFSLNPTTAAQGSKRGDDARLRLNALSEIPREWISHVKEWIEVNHDLKQNIDGQLLPVLNDEYFIYQLILSGFPEDLIIDSAWIERLKEYLINRVREDEVHSNREQPNDDYEKACLHFVDGLLKEDSDFYMAFLPFAKRVIEIASVSSLAQVVIKITAPGVPDINQGCELFDLNYAHDTGRSVDYALRINLLQKIKEASSDCDWESTKTLFEKYKNVGVKKLFVTWKALNFRQRNSALFENGAYIPLRLLGVGRSAIGYARYLDDKWCVVVVPVSSSSETDTTRDDNGQNFISLPANSPTKWRNIFTDEHVDVREGKLTIAELLRNFPVAVLSNDL